MIIYIYTLNNWIIYHHIIYIYTVWYKYRLLSTYLNTDLIFDLIPSSKWPRSTPHLHRFLLRHEPTQLTCHRFVGPQIGGLCKALMAKDAHGIPGALMNQRWGRAFIKMSDSKARALSTLLQVFGLVVAKVLLQFYPNSYLQNLRCFGRELHTDPWYDILVGPPFSLVNSLCAPWLHVYIYIYTGFTCVYICMYIHTTR